MGFGNKKTIKIMVDDEPCYQEFSLEEVLNKFDNMIKKFANQCVSKLDGYKEATDEFEDYAQMGRIKLISIYEAYDLSKDACFSTILHTSLRNTMVDIIRGYEAQKRRAKATTSSLDESLVEDGTLGEVIADESFTTTDTYTLDEVEELETFLKNNLSKDEIMYLTIALKKQVGRSNKEHRSNLQMAIDIFSDVVGEIDDTKTDLAQVLGISRPTLNKRIKTTMEKVQMLTESYFVKVA